MFGSTVRQLEQHETGFLTVLSSEGTRGDNRASRPYKQNQFKKRIPVLCPQKSLSPQFGSHGATKKEKDVSRLCFSHVRADQKRAGPTQSALTLA